MLGGSRGGFSTYLVSASELANLASGVWPADADEDEEKGGDGRGGKRMALARAVVDAKTVKKKRRRRGLKKRECVSLLVLGFEDIIIFSIYTFGNDWLNKTQKWKERE